MKLFGYLVKFRTLIWRKDNFFPFKQFVHVTGFITLEWDWNQDLFKCELGYWICIPPVCTSMFYSCDGICVNRLRMCRGTCIRCHLQQNDLQQRNQFNLLWNWKWFIREGSLLHLFATVPLCTFDSRQR